MIWISTVTSGYHRPPSGDRWDYALPTCLRGRLLQKRLIDCIQSCLNGVLLCTGQGLQSVHCELSPQNNTLQANRDKKTALAGEAKMRINELWHLKHTQGNKETTPVPSGTVATHG